MEKRLREYEKEVAKMLKDGKFSPAEQERHWRMVAAFQHERLIHLLVTLFFAGVMVLFLGTTVFLSLTVPVWPYLAPIVERIYDIIMEKVGTMK